MKKILTKAMIPALLVVGSLGVGATVVTVPAFASTKTAAVAAKTYSGTVKTANTVKDSFTLTVGTTTYTVHYSAKTTFSKGTAANIKVGAAVSATGKLHKTLISATSVSA